MPKMVYVHIRPFARSFHSIAFHYIEYMGVIGASLYPSFGAQKKMAKQMRAK